MSTVISPEESSGSESVLDDSSEVGADDPAEEVDAEPVEDEFDESPPVFDPSDPVELSVELDWESGSAHATPGVFATAAPIPNATANAPTRPTYRA
jgi:hypothetical protein